MPPSAPPSSTRGLTSLSLAPMDDPWVAGLAGGRIPEVGRLRGPLLVIPRSFAPGRDWDMLCNALPRIRDAWYFPPGCRIEQSPMELRMCTGSNELAEV